MTTQLHTIGEEAIQRDFFEESLDKPTSVDVGLYHDGEVSGDTTNGDDLTDDSALGDITTEPSDGNYARQTASFGTTDFSSANAGGDWESIIGDQTFDMVDTTGTVDAFFFVITFTSGEAGDSGATDHLFYTGTLDQAYDLSNITDQFTLDGAGLSLT